MTDKDIFAQLRQLADEAATRKTGTQPSAAPAGAAAGGLRIEDLIGAAKTARDAQTQAGGDAPRSKKKTRSGS